MIGSATFPTQDKFEFVSLAECKKEKFPEIKKIFEHVLTPFYGEKVQTLLDDIKERKERKTEILRHNGRDVGCIIYKRNLLRKHPSEELSDCLEVSFMSLFHPKSDKERGYQKRLIERIEEVAKELRAKSVIYVLPQEMEAEFVPFEVLGFEKKYLEQKDSIPECIFFKTLQKKRKTEEESSKPKQHELTLKQPYLGQIQSGLKTVEGRINNGLPKRCKVGDTMRFFNHQTEVLCTITKIETFTGFREMLDATGFKKCIPSASTLDAAFGEYQKISGYIERAKNSGVLALHIKKI